MNVSDPSVVDVNGLSKRFGQFTAVDDISFQVRRGEVFGLLGPNGAGKTTTIRCLLTLSKPTLGEARVCGVDVLKQPEKVRQLCGYVPQGVSVDGDLTAYENLLFYAKLFDVPAAERKERIQEILHYMQIADRANGLVKTFSGGMMRRLEVGQALLHKPEVLFLDEPSIGLDPAAKRVIWDRVLHLRDKFHTSVLITTHDMHEADHLCDRIAIMNGGKIAVIGSPAELKAELGGDVLSIASPSPNCVQVLQQSEYQLLTSSQTGTVDLVVNEGDREIPRVLALLQAEGISIEAISLKQPTLDDVFLRYSGKHIDEGDSAYRSTRAMRKAIGRLAK